MVLVNGAVRKYGMTHNGGEEAGTVPCEVLGLCGKSTIFRDAAKTQCNTITSHDKIEQQLLQFGKHGSYTAPHPRGKAGEQQVRIVDFTQRARSMLCSVGRSDAV